MSNETGETTMKDAREECIWPVFKDEECNCPQHIVQDKDKTEEELKRLYAKREEGTSAGFVSFLNKMRQETASWPKWKRENAAYLFLETVVLNKGQTMKPNYQNAKDYLLAQPDGILTKAQLLEYHRLLEGNVATPKKLQVPTTGYIIEVNGHFHSMDFFPSTRERVSHEKRIRTLNRLWQFASQVETVSINEEGYDWQIDDEGISTPGQNPGWGTPLLLPRFKTLQDAKLVLDSLDDDDIETLKGIV